MTDPRVPKAQRFAWALWAALGVVVTILVVAQPERRTVTPNYFLGSLSWWAGRDLYGPGVHGYLYPPQFAILYTPFAVAPRPLGDLLWRWCNLTLFVSALYRLARLRPGGSFFPILTVLSFPACLSSARTGQVNMTEAALMVHAAVDLARCRWWWASLSLSMGVALKPVALVMAVLAATLGRTLLWRLSIAGILVVLLPFLFGHPAYAIAQYDAFFQKLMVSSMPVDHAFCDLNGLLAAAGMPLTAGPSAALRLLGFLGVFSLWRVGSERLGEPDRSLLLLSLSASYLMLFNPRTETNSYVILAPAVAAWAARALALRGRGRWILAGLALGLGSDNYPLHHVTDLWLKPALCLLFLSYLTHAVFTARSKDLGDRPALPASSPTIDPPWP